MALCAIEAAERVRRASGAQLGTVALPTALVDLAHAVSLMGEEPANPRQSRGSFIPAAQFLI